MIEDDLATLRAWSARQDALRLVAGPPLTNDEIDDLPDRIARDYPYALSVPFQPEDFVVPRSYRTFLRTCSYLRIEHRTERGWRTYEPLNILSPAEVAAGPSFASVGTMLDDDEIYSSFLVAFATAGYAVEASRWCFYTDPDIERQDGELPILCESNDYECDLVKLVETRQWGPQPANVPAALSFADWFHRLVGAVTARPFDASRSDEVPNSFYEPDGS